MHRPVRTGIATARLTCARACGAGGGGFARRRRVRPSVRLIVVDALTRIFLQLSSSNDPAKSSTGTNMRLVAGRRLGRSHLQLTPLSLLHLLLLVSAVAVGGVPLRIANDGVDSVVLAPIGRETIIIDTASNFHGKQYLQSVYMCLRVCVL